MDRLQRIDRLLQPALLFASWALSEVGSDVAPAAPSHHSRAATWAGENLNLVRKCDLHSYTTAELRAQSRSLRESANNQKRAAAEAVTNQKTPLFRDGALKKKYWSSAQLATAAELVLELFNATSSVDEALLTSEGGVRIGSDITNHDLVFRAVDCFCLAATHRGLRQELVAS